MPDEIPAAEDETDRDTTDAAETAAAKPITSGVAILAFLAIGLLSALVTLAVKNMTSHPGSGGTQAVESQVREAQLRNEINARRNELNMPPLEESGRGESLEDMTERLRKDVDLISATAAGYQKLIQEKTEALNVRNEAYLKSEQLRDGLADQVSRLKLELQKAMVGGSDVEGVRRDLAEVKAQRDALTSELAVANDKLRAMAANPEAADYDELKRRYDEAVRAKEFFEARCKELEGTASKSKLFASTETELLPAAVELFRSLRALEGGKDSDLMTSYSGLGAKLNANVLKTIDFNTGDSNLTDEQMAGVNALMPEVPDGDLVLVIGYASKTGDAVSNQHLSSDRATAVAQYISSVKRSGQNVQAVYLGQTDRFSSRIPERNQICEIWRVRAK